VVRSDVTGVILCGGEARRMDGVDKPLALLAGRPMVAHVHARLAPQVTRVIISANRSQAEYAAVCESVVSDVTPGLGPLGGVVSALAIVDTPWAFCCPGDAPFLPVDLVQRLAETIGADMEIVVPHDGVQLQPLFMLMRSAMRDGLASYLASGGRSVHGWLKARQTTVVTMEDVAAQFLNINSWDALAQASETLDTA
jgi:molybdenum cofactor guanylyltransferase